MEFKNLIKEICYEEGIEYKLLSKNWIIALTKNNITKCISGYRFPLNDHAVGGVIDDKYAFYDLCNYLNIPIIKHQILFNTNSKLGINTYELANKYFEEYNKNVVLKPNNGTEGTGVYHIENKEELINILNKLFINHFSISICPFYNIDKEYRVIILDKDIKLIFEKSKPIVIGNGFNTIKELLTQLNPYYFKNKLKEEKYDKILKKNEIYEYDWRFNLSKGAKASLVTDKNVISKLSAFALDVVSKINAKFVSVDIIISNNILYLIEVNSGVCINKVCNFIDKDLKIIKEIYREAIKKMFED